tara:strand:+ start:8261 stop:9460 length:1200 start_codon:yes stop_codon:yes gene_type:complete
VSIIIIGGSHAGISLAENLRRGGYKNKITIIEKQKNIPTEKPPLSKKFLESTFDEENIKLRNQSWFKDNLIEILLNIKSLEVFPHENFVRLYNKVEINYDYLVIASGAKANKLPIELIPIESQNILRDFNDIKKIKDNLLDKKHTTIIGGGYIGLELASSLRKADFEVNIIEMSERILQRVASKELSNFFTSLHEENGVKIFCNERLEKIKPLGSAFQINTNKNKFNTDLLLVGIGVTPEIELAKNIGVSYDRGIIVNENYETSLKNIFAIGDCALNKSEYGIVIESIHHAQFSASRVSSYILGQSKIKYEEPWFWSDQFDVKFQSVGLYRPNSETIFRKGKREGSKSWWSFNNQKLVCVEAINDVQNFSFAKRIFENKISVNKNQIEDQNFDLKSLIT